MCARTVFSVLAIVVLGFCRVASATVVYDDFLDPGATGLVDPSLWTFGGGLAPVVAGSNVTLTSPAVKWSQIYSTGIWDATTTKFEYKLTSYTAPEDGVYMGVLEASTPLSGNGAWIECRAGVWQMEVSDTSHDVRSAAFTAPLPGDVLGITRSGGTFTATDNGVPVASMATTGLLNNMEVLAWSPGR